MLALSIQQAGVAFLCPTGSEHDCLAPGCNSDSRSSDLAAVKEGSARRLEECRQLSEPAYVVATAPGLDFPTVTISRCATALVGRSPEAHGPQGPQSPPGLDWQSAVRHRAEVSQQEPNPRRRHVQLKLAARLEELESENASCVVAVRRINKLGFESSAILSQHYSSFGIVKKVLVSNAHTGGAGAPFRIRLRPSGLGYVVMQRREDAAAVLAAGEVQHVNSIPIEVRAFQSRSDLLAQGAGADDDSCSQSTATRCPSISSSGSDEVASAFSV